MEKEAILRQVLSHISLPEVREREFSPAIQLLDYDESGLSIYHQAQETTRCAAETA
jgi:hypothetical protein